MPSFKPKTNKKVIVDEIKAATLDTKHNEIIESFQKDEEEVIPNLTEKINELKELIKTQTGDTKRDNIDKIKEMQ